MAEMIAPQKGNRRNLHATRIDFTPMVDLGFILITFFIYTTTIARPGTLEIIMPSAEATQGPTVYDERSTITLMPVTGHNVVYYEGALQGRGQMKVQPVASINSLLRQMKKRVADLPLTLSAQAHKLHVIIKPNDDCKYEDVVRLLDDMNLVDVPYYAMVDITPEERTMVQAIADIAPGR
jgi:biopolymer transport protein ExbD